jgi:hypothetical protein
MAWALESEDFRNNCGEGANPLLRAASEVLGRLWLNSNNKYIWSIVVHLFVIHCQ